MVTQKLRITELDSFYKNRQFLEFSLSVEIEQELVVYII